MILTSTSMLICAPDVPVSAHVSARPKEGALVAQLECHELIKGSGEVLVLEDMSLVASGQYRADSATVSVGGLGQ
jgi:hypothetical protein